MLKTWTYAVTFERPETMAPQTVRGEVQAGGLQSAVSKAAREAKKARPGQRYDSVLVLVEKPAKVTP